MDDLITVEDLLKLGEELRASPEKKDGVIDVAGRLLRVRNREGLESPLTANRAQRDFEAKRLNRNIVLKARQMGITTWVAGRFFLKTITQRGVLTVQVAHTRESAESIFRIAQRFWECLPESYRKGALKTSRSNVRQMVFPALDSEFRVLSAADMGCGRGLTIQNLHCSEVSRWPGDGRETLAGLRAALAPGGEMVVESTANGAYGCFYEEWTRAVDRGVARHFLPWWLEDAYVAEPADDWTDEELELVVRHDLTSEQIGFRRGLEAEFGVLRSQEFAEDAEQCFRATGDCCFDVDAIERRQREVAEPRTTQDRETLLAWAPPVAGKRYIVAVDTAGGGPEGDYAVAQVVDMETGMQCAELQKRLRPAALAYAVLELAKEYRGALIVVERNNHGGTVLAHLEQAERELAAHRAELYVHEDGQAGWLTTAPSKARAIVQLGLLLINQPEMFHSRRLLAECRTYVSQANGGTGAAAGANDDCVMAMAIAQAVRAGAEEAGAAMSPFRYSMLLMRGNAWRSWRYRQSGGCGAVPRAS